MWWMLDGLDRPAHLPDGAAPPPPSVVGRLLGVPEERVLRVWLERRSLDARPRTPVFRYRCRIELAAGPPPTPRPLAGIRAEPCEPPPVPAPVPKLVRPAGHRPVVIGAGPAGLFAALALARAGAPPLLLERGDPVERRTVAVAAFRRGDGLDPESNVVFGEGGAGTFSDGKVYTRSRSSLTHEVLRELVDLGAPPELMFDAYPHIGTDRLRAILGELRGRLTTLGVELRFRTRLESLEIHGGRIEGIGVTGGERIGAQAVVLAVGHHARDTLDTLRRSGVPMEARPTAIGLRIEHRQRDVDRWLYGQRHPRGLPPGFYRLTRRPGGDQPRPVYSFCMCPGGVIVAAPERDGRVVTNGMSGSRRSGRHANAGIVVPVGEEDYAGDRGDPLRGVRFLEELEARAFEAGGGDFIAPAQRAADFVAGRASDGPLRSTYRPGVVPGDLAALLPAPVAASLRSALATQERGWRGFAGAHAMLVGLETRTSSPVRLERGPDGQSAGVRGIFPAGEGAGHAGGILSAAADGLRTAAAVVEQLAIDLD
jgi:uncharacterized protein